MNTETTLASIDQLHDLLESVGAPGTLFRGVSDCDYTLTPSVGRLRNRFRSDKDFILAEIGSLEAFRKEYRAYTDRVLADDWELIALAHHHGLPTRILDWSFNPLAALYFAVAQAGSCDAALFVFPQTDDLSLAVATDPVRRDQQALFITQPYAFTPPRLSSRITSQTGAFTIHPRPWVAFDSPVIRKLRIPVALRQPVRDMVERYGVNPKSLFPGLDGLAGWVKDLRFGYDAGS